MHGFKKAVKQILLALTLSVVLLASVLLINTLRFTSKQIQVEPIQPVGVDEGSVAPRLAQALRFQTVSQDIRGEEFLAFHRYLEQTFPKAHSTLTRELVGEYSLLYTWKGRDERLKPILLMAHQDVMPVEPETLARWEQPPFEGRITDGYIWGRGAMDDKCTVLGIMEAVEMLSGQGLQPQRTIYLAFGHDEEVGGYGGAAKIAGLLRERNVELEYVLDEGSPIADGFFPGVSQPVALIGIADKGYLSLELSVEAESGHSSMPPPSIAGVPRQTLEYVGPEMPFGRKLVLGIKRERSAEQGTGGGEFPPPARRGQRARNRTRRRSR